MNNLEALSTDALATLLNSSVPGSAEQLAIQNELDRRDILEDEQLERIEHEYLQPPDCGMDDVELMAFEADEMRDILDLRTVPISALEKMLQHTAGAMNREIRAELFRRRNIDTETPFLFDNSVMEKTQKRWKSPGSFVE